MNAILRRYRPGLLTLVVYVALIGFALASSLELL